jgi:hypothetical protein
VNVRGFFVYGWEVLRRSAQNTYPMRYCPFLLLLCMLLSCGQEPEQVARMLEMNLEVADGTGYLDQSAPAAAAAADVAAPNPPIIGDRKIIRTGELHFEVGDLDAARGRILEQVKATSGYVEGDDRNNYGSSFTVRLRVRIPATRFDAFLSTLSGLGTLQNQDISANDVTEEWVDVEARLGAKKAVEQRYLEIVTQAKKVSEVLEVERELGNVRTEIESMEARMRSLRDQVAMSTLTITCTKPQPNNEVLAPHFGVALKEGWFNLVRAIASVLQVWPFVLLGSGLLWWLVRRWKGRRKAAVRA